MVRVYAPSRDLSDASSLVPILQAHCGVYETPLIQLDHRTKLSGTAVVVPTQLPCTIRITTRFYYRKRPKKKRCKQNTDAPVDARRLLVPKVMFPFLVSVTLPPSPAQTLHHHPRTILTIPSYVQTPPPPPFSLPCLAHLFPPTSSRASGPHASPCSPSPSTYSPPEY